MMRRVRTATGYEVTLESDAEVVLKGIHNRLMDHGFGPGQATAFISGAHLPPELRTPCEELDALLTNDMLEWLND